MNTKVPLDMLANLLLRNLSPKCMAAYLQIPVFGAVNNRPRQPSR